ncbi:hypothetical protein WK70_21955 [Burkholderia cepacia]|nr:hypothetical protein WK70_21955 [Burkholderia cepacia]
MSRTPLTALDDWQDFTLFEMLLAARFGRGMPIPRFGACFAAWHTGALFPARFRHDRWGLWDRWGVRQVESRFPGAGVLAVGIRQVRFVQVQPVRLRVAQHAQYLVDEDVGLGQALLGGAQAWEWSGAYEHTMIDTLDPDIVALEQFT